MLSLFAVVSLLVGLIYCWTNRSGHTGFDPYLGFALFAPIFIIGISVRLMTRGRLHAARAAEVTGFIGLVFIPFITELGILQEYEKWAAAGMPERHPYADLLLAGFLLGGFGGSLVVAYIATKQAQQVSAPDRCPPRS